MTKTVKGQWAVFACAVIWSTSGLCVKLVDWNPMIIAGVRSAIAGVFMLIVRRLTYKGPAKKYGGGRLYFWGAGIAYSLTMILFVIANKLTSSANVIVLQYTAPIWAALLGWALAKEKPRTEHWIALGAVFVGLFIFFKDGFVSKSFLGDCLAVLSGISFGANSVFMRLQKKANPADSMILSHVITALAGIPFLFLFMPAFRLPTVSAVLYMGIIQIGVASVLFSYGIKEVPAVQTMLIAAIEPVLNPVWVFAVTGEKPGVSAVIGGCIIITAVAFTAVIQRFRKYG
jgi:drug/metabolite transporter (DMT)-like permease